MIIKIINPNTTSTMTEKIFKCARAVASVDTQIIAVNPSMGPVSIESHYDEAIATPGILQEIIKGEKERVDGYVIACFGDPGLQAARELATGPVLGIAQAAMQLASFVGRRFSVVTTLQRTVGQAWHLAQFYGMQKFCANVRACNIAVLDLENNASHARDKIFEECQRALVEDDSDVIVLGCAGMADLCNDLTKKIRAPVIDGVSAAIKLAEALVSLQIGISKRGEFDYPIPKPVKGLLSDFSLIQ